MTRLFELIATRNILPDGVLIARFGLVGYVRTEDLKRAMRTAAGMRTGTVMINTPIVRDLRTGFGAYKQSGLGREGAKGSQAMFTGQRSSPVRNRRFRAWA